MCIDLSGILGLLAIDSNSFSSFKFYRFALIIKEKGNYIRK